MKHKAMRLFIFCLILVLLLGSFPFALATEETSQESAVPTEAAEGTAPSTEPTEFTETIEPTEEMEAAGTAEPPSRTYNPEGHVSKTGIVWSTDPSKAFDAVFNGNTNHVDSLSLFTIKHNGAYVPCYCIAPGLSLGTGSPYEKHELTTSDAWISLTELQRQAIGLAMIYGYPNSINPSTMFEQKGAQAATQMIIWEICYGMRKTTHPYNCTDSRYIDLFNPDSWGNQFTDGGTGTGSGMIYNLKACYQQISDKMAQHFEAPSFMSADTDTAQIFDMTPNGNGTYSVTLTDSNNMLSAINFKNTDTLTFTKSGSKLTITASKPISETTVKATKNVPNLEAQTFIIWTHTDKQPVAEPLAPTNDPTSLYLKLRIRTGNLGIKKTTSDGKMLGGWKFTLYSDQACTKQVYGPYTTASDGTISAKDLLIGTYWIKEVGNTDSAVQAKYKCEGENPRKITITAGKTTSVTFNNILKTGNLEIKKTTSDGKMLGGWKFVLYSNQACTKQVYGPYTTASDGTIIAKDILVGTYWIKEVGNTDSAVQAKYKCEGENPRKITITAGQTTSVTFNNVLKTGNLGIKKTTSDGKMLGGWKFVLYSDQACTKQVYGPYTTASDGTISAKDLLAGTYWIKEVGNADSAIQARYKCEGENPRKITLTDGKTTSVAFNNILQVGNVKLIKKTNTGGSLAGWKIGIYTDAACTKPISGSPFVTGSDGSITVPNLEIGVYYAKEVDESAKYPYWKFDSSVKKVTVEAGKTASVTFSNTQYGRLRIKKNAVNGTPEGWRFDLLNASKEVIATLKTDSDGYAYSDLLLPGKYYVREIHDRTEIYWTYDAEVEKGATVTAGKDITIEYTNEQFGRISFRKTTDTGKYLEGWVFRVTDEAGNLVGEYTTDYTGYAVTGKLKPGKYFVTEVAKDDPYWVVNVETHTVDAMAGRTVEDNWHNSEYGMGTFRKTTNTGTDLEGWQFTVYSDEEYQNVVAVVTTDADGEVSRMFEPGRYYVKETGDTKGRFESEAWTIDKVVRVITIRPHEESTVSFRNNMYGKISVQKVDPEGNPLADAVFRLEWSKDGKRWDPVYFQKGTAPEGSCSNRDVVDGKLTTAKDGIITWGRLHTALYYRLTEVKAPNGYTLLTEPAFEGKLPAESPIVTLRVVNAYKFEMPQTGSGAMLRLPLALIFCTLVCAGSLFCLKKKKRE